MFFLKKPLKPTKKQHLIAPFWSLKAFSLLPEKVAEVFGLYRIDFQKTVGYFFFKGRNRRNIKKGSITLIY
jgi:hypothetical protein